MTKPVNTAVPLVMTALLVACLPAPYGVYYRPAYPDASAQLSGAWCQGQAGPPARLTIQGPDGLALTLATEQDAADTPHAARVLRVNVSLPQGSRFQFLSDSLELDEAATGRPLRVAALLNVFAVQDSTAGDWIDLATQGPTDLAAARQSLVAFPGQTLATVSVLQGEQPGFSPARLDVAWPRILLAASPAESLIIGPIQLQAQPPEKVYLNTVYRTRTQLLALDQRVQNCKTLTPERRCDQIPLGEPTSFREGAGDFAFSGRVWSTTHNALAALRYDLQLDTRYPGSWRLEGGPVQWVDSTTGAARTSVIGPMRVYWRYTVPLATPLRASPEKPTSFRFEIPLQAPEQARYVLHLPPYLMNGVRHQFKPVELERRSFDGGLQPFNC